MRRKVIVGGVIGLVVLVVGLYFGSGWVIYNSLSNVADNCGEDDRQNTPDSFTARQVDPAPYLMPDYEAVSFPSRDANITISGWYVPAADTADAPSVILVHGLRACKGSSTVLLPAGMLHRAGFNVLLIDLRDHGESTVEDRRYAGGTEEYRDVLGAWDWLAAEKDASPQRIGLFGVSLGAATVMIAAGEEPNVAAVWEDSGFADINEAIQAELSRNGFPTFLAPAGVLIGRLIAGDDIASLSPLRAVDRLDGRPVFIAHGDADTRLSVQYAYDLADAMRAHGWQVEPWIAPGSEHVLAMFEHHEEYEARLVAFFREHLSEAVRG